MSDATPADQAPGGSAADGPAPPQLDRDLLALHALAVRKAGDAEAVARIVGLPADDAVAGLEAAVAAGHAAGAKGTWMATPAGRAHLDSAYPVVFGDLRANGTLSAAYDRFEKVNRELLALFTDWQSAPTPGGGSTPNDHSDPDYDARIVDRLGQLHERAERVLARLAEALPRVARYTERLAEAYDRVLAGDSDYVTGVRVDSYHTVWFELHEDLLRVLGRTREDPS